MASTPSFVLPIAPSGSITITEPAAKVYLLTFNSPPDNRLTPVFCDAFLLALDIVEAKLPKGVVVTTSAIPKFYSNGLDYESAVTTRGFFQNHLYPLWRRLLTYPMPTVALINGHAFAAGLMTAMMQDYRIMNPHKGFACLNELDFGAPLPPAMASIFRQKLPRPAAYRSMVLESRRFGALEALNEGIVDGVGGMAEVEALIRDRRLVGRADGGSYGQLKEEMWRETVRHMDKSVREDEADAAARAETASLLQAGAAARVAAWESKSRVGKTKL